MAWELRNDDNLLYYQCTALNNQTVVQATTTSSAGNMALHTGDEVEVVVKNRQNFLEKIGLNLNQLVAARQVHGVNITKVETEDSGKGAYSSVDFIEDTDALITRVPGVVLSIYTADCLPIFIYDQATPSIGIVHAGWRGTIDQIVVKTLEKMNEYFQTEPIHCQIGIGPSICSECFKVDAVLAERFQDADPSSLKIKKQGSEEQYFVNLTGFNINLLKKVGVPINQIYCSNSCTCCQPELLFSHRSTATRGRIMGIISLTE